MIEKVIQEMRRSRGWDKTDMVAILTKSIVIEAAELLECFQWTEEEYDIDDVKGELADILMYTISLCMDLGLDYKEIVKEKIIDVKDRYPGK